MANIGTLSPFAFPTAIPVNRILLCLPQTTLFFLKVKGLVWKAVKMVSSGYLERIVSSVASSQGAVISSVTDLHSPAMVLKDMLYLQKRREKIVSGTYTLSAIDDLY